MRKLILGLWIVHLAVIGSVGLVLGATKPGPSSQVIQGIGIGDPAVSGHIAYISGQRLACTPLAAEDEFAAHCTITIMGQPLEIRARRNGLASMNALGGTCTAAYMGREWPCEIGMHFTNMPWFAYMTTPLGLTSHQVDALRQQYWVENLPEQTFITLAVGLATITLVLGLVTLPMLVQPRVQRKPVTALITVFVNLMALPFVFLLFLWLTAGFWD